MISIIIPTHRRKEILKKCLERFLEIDQEIDFEILVIEDGARDAEAIMNDFSSLNIRYFSQEKKGQGAARNLGIDKSRGDILLFIGDDILVEKNFLSEHKKFHELHKEANLACIGPSKFHSSFESRFSRWLEEYGFQFDFKKLEKGREADFWHFYTSNISLKKEILGMEKFDEDFSHYGFEDIELGFRLKKKKNLKIHFIPEAKATHFHKITEEDFYERVKSCARSAKIFADKHPDAGVIPKGIKLVLQKIIATFPGFFAFLRKEWGFYARAKKAFFEGMQDSHFVEDLRLKI